MIPLGEHLTDQNGRQRGHLWVAALDSSSKRLEGHCIGANHAVLGSLLLKRTLDPLFGLAQIQGDLLKVQGAH